MNTISTTKSIATFIPAPSEKEMLRFLMKEGVFDYL